LRLRGAERHKQADKPRTAKTRFHGTPPVRVLREFYRAGNAALKPSPRRSMM